MGFKDKLAAAVVDPMNDPRLSLGDRALAVAVGVQVEKAVLNALRQHDEEKQVARWKQIADDAERER